MQCYPKKPKNLTLAKPDILQKAVAMDKQSLLEEIDRLGWHAHDGEVYKKGHFNHWCGTFKLNHGEMGGKES